MVIPAVLGFRCLSGICDRLKFINNVYLGGAKIRKKIEGTSDKNQGTRYKAQA
jgi:hypothetical protein